MAIRYRTIPASYITVLLSLIHSLVRPLVDHTGEWQEWLSRHFFWGLIWAKPTLCYMRKSRDLPNTDTTAWMAGPAWTQPKLLKVLEWYWYGLVELIVVYRLGRWVWAPVEVSARSAENWFCGKPTIVTDRTFRQPYVSSFDLPCHTWPLLNYGQVKVHALQICT